MRRGGWRGALVVILAMAMVAVLAPAGLAKKPTDKPGGGPKDSPLVVDLVDVEGNLMFTVRPDDTVYFRVSLYDDAASGTLVVSTDRGYERTLTLDQGLSESYAIEDADVEGQSFSGTATYEGETATFEFDVFAREKDCVTEVGLEETVDGYSGDFPDGVTCMLDLGIEDHDRFMRVRLWASGESNKPTKVFLTMRDNIPGNWCAVDPESGSGFTGRLRPGEEVLPDYELYWLFPESGICVKGGRGGEMIGDGYPGQFYLVVTGRLELTWVESP